MTSMLANHSFNITDPFYANNLQHIPDINHTGRGFYTFYWRTEIDLAADAGTAAGGAGAVSEDECPLLWLRLRGINYRAQVWMNGKIIPEDGGSTAVEGMFRRWNYLLPTTTTGPHHREQKRHVLAVLVEPPPYPGKVGPGVGQGGSHDLAKSTTMQFAGGWDWIQGTPDRNTGMWDKVELDSTGVVTISDPVVRTVTLGGNGATLEAVAGLKRRGGSKAVMTGTLRCTINEVGVAAALSSKGFGVGVAADVAAGAAPIVVEVRNVRLEAGSTVEEVKFPQINVSDPKLWNPWTHGVPYLYNASFEFIIDGDSGHSSNADDAAGKNGNTINPADGGTGVDKTTTAAPPSSLGQHQKKPASALTTDVANIKFGIRTMESFLHPVTKGRAFKVNGVDVFLTGGNWITTDQFLRHATSSARYYNEVRMHREMGMNLLRVWGGGITERPEFYDAADALGVLVMQEFWMTGDNNGRWAGNYSWPLNHAVYLDNAKDMIKMVRHHPSLLFWCGGNELYPVESNPSKDIALGLKSLVSTYDPGRYYITSSMSNYTDYDPNFALAPKDGPYGMLLRADFYERNPGLTFWNGEEKASPVSHL